MWGNETGWGCHAETEEGIYEGQERDGLPKLVDMGPHQRRGGAGGIGGKIGSPLEVLRSEIREERANWGVTPAGVRSRPLRTKQKKRKKN